MSKNRFKKSIVGDIKQEIEFKGEQEKLKDKYNIESDDSNVVVVEKTNAYKFTVNMAVSLVKLAATVVLLALAVVGLLTLVYPSIRNEFLQIMAQILLQLRTLINI